MKKMKLFGPWEWNGLSFLSHNNSLSAGVAVLFSKISPLSHMKWMRFKRKNFKD